MLYKSKHCSKKMFCLKAKNKKKSSKKIYIKISKRRKATKKINFKYFEMYKKWHSNGQQNIKVK